MRQYIQALKQTNKQTKPQKTSKNITYSEITHEKGGKKERKGRKEKLKELTHQQTSFLRILNGALREK